MRIFSVAANRWNRVQRHTRGCCWLVCTAVLLACPLSQAQVATGPPPATMAAADAPLPDAPSVTAPPSENFLGTAASIGKTIGEDEWHLIKAPFHKKALIWDGLFLAATGVLIANDESVMYQVPVAWHNTSLNISDGALYGASAIAGGIYLTGLFTSDEHSQEVGIRTAEATADSVIMYGAMKAIFQRQRPYTGPGEGNFFAGNWTNGSFPSGHAMFTLDHCLGRCAPVPLHSAGSCAVRTGEHGYRNARDRRATLPFRRLCRLDPGLPDRRLRRG